MRSLVCAQCHVEYFFKGDGKYLTFPWDKGFTVEDMEAYYDEAGFYDYIHKLSRTPILKAQHPDYEIAQMGIHGQRGVSCADCHMPYKSEGGVKFSDHHIQSPLAMIDRTLAISSAKFSCFFSMPSPFSKRTKSVTAWNRNWRKRISKLNLPGIMERQKLK